MAKVEALKNHLETLRNAIPELKGVLLASTEGLPIAHSMTNGADPNRVAAMAAAASTLGRKVSETMNAGRWAKSPCRPKKAVVRVLRGRQGRAGGPQPARRKRRVDSPGSARHRQADQRIILER